MNVASCFVIGGRSFLIRCVEQLLDLGFDVRGIFSNDADVVRWADQHSIACMPAQGQALEQLAGERFDYLFSIVNLSVLPESVVQAPAKAAINFHDGPLPRYAGLNTPAWAIINGEAGHGITWHYMTGGVDEGDILTQRQLTIDADETSLSLNGKCYEAGLDAFSELLGRLQKGGLEATPQDLSQRNYFAYCQRPEAAGLLDLRQPAERLSALMRALDFGNYENPLGLPKLWLGERAVVISGHKIEFGASSEAPGTLLKVNEAGLLVSTASRDLLLTGLRDFGGEVLCPLQTLRAAGLQAGDRLSLPDTTLIERIEAADAAACRTENRWRGALTRLEPVAVPYAKRIAAAGQTRARNSRAMELPQGVNGRRALAAFAHYLSRLNGQGSFDLLYGDCAKLSASRECAGQVVPLVPWRIDIAGAESADTLYCALENELAQLAGRSAHASDLGLRLGDAGGKTGADGISAVPVAIIAGEVEAIEDLERVPLLLVAPQSGGTLQWHYDSDVYDDATLAHMQNQYAALLTAVLEDGQRTPARYSVLSTAERERLLTEWNATAVDYPIGQTIHGLFEAQAARTPDATALVFQNDALSYRELNERSNLLAHDLLARGVTRDSLVGVALERSTEMVVALLAILKAGGAYVPMDPHYPHDRLLYMAEDAGLSLILCERGHFRLFDGLSAELLDPRETATGALSQNPASTADPASLAYVIYTSGSTGNPKGVMVEHRNIVNFFTGMDARIGADTPGTWLAVTSISFDISVLELFWTLCRGYKMVLYAGDEEHQPERPVVSRYPDRHIDFSLFFWNYSSNEDIQEHSKYHLLMEAAKFGDRHGFVAAWTPERHFHSFGGLFPNPSVISAALAAVTENIHLRSGSVVLPLHSPIRVAEEWAVVDNLSDGRVGIGVAAGWQPNDFAIRPENHANAKQVMMESLEQVRRLWRGETLTFPGPKGDVELTTLPRPVQPELPVWLTAAGNPETFRMAGEAGCGILTHLLGQSVEDVNSSIAIYREAWRDAGHPGEGHVVLMLHTFIGEDEDEVKAIARGPMKSYLTNAATLVKAAAWHFPTFKDLSERGVKTIDEFVDNISAEDFDDLLEFAFERYYSTSGLFGTPERALRLVDQLKKIGVDEIGCLVDYGIEADQVLAHLPWLEQVRQAANPQREAPENDFSIPALLRRHQASHFQCTPSMATMLLADPSSRDALAGLDCMMVGGEALPPALAGELHELVSGKVVNMYGPTETTIWSSTHSLEADLQLVPIGRPIANTSIYLLDGNRQPVPIGVPGELYIGGAGVVRGYLKRPELTAERFLDDPFVPGARIYRTGDLARYREDGVLDFLGRVDHQVKIRGHRIELGEIEARLGQHPDVLECVVVDRADCSGARMLVAYLTPLAGARPAAQVLRLFLGEKLPEFMLPSHFVAIDTLPKTPNGKIDRNALPEPGAVRASAGDYIAPRDALEEAVTDIWREVLLVQQIGMQDNFFDLGGHSLTAAQLIARLRATFGVELPLRTLFEASTVEQVAARLRQQQTEAGSVDEIAELVREIYALSPKTLALELSRQRRDDAEADPQVTEATSDDARAAQCEELLERRRRNRPHAAGESIPALGLAEPRLSFSQRRMWFIDQLEPGAHYNDNFALILDGALDSTALERAVNAIVGRHQVLRTHFATHEGEPYQAIVGDLPIELVQVDLDKLQREARDAALQEEVRRRIRVPFDLAKGPLLRTVLFRLDAERHVLLLVIHQAVNDSWSLGRFCAELGALYSAFVDGVDDPLPPLEIQYGDYAEWQRQELDEEELADDLTYWKEHLAGELQVLELPLDHPRPAQQTFNGARQPVALSAGLRDRLTALAQANGCTLYMALLALFKVLLYRYSGQSDVIVGSPIANRNHRQLEPLLGMFVNTIALRTDLGGNPDIPALLRRVRQTATQGYAHAELPFERLVQALHPPADMSRTPIFQVLFDYHNTPMPTPAMQGLRADATAFDPGMSRFDLTLELADRNGMIAGWFEYNSDLFDAETIAALADHWQQLLEAAVAAPDTPIDRLPLLTADEERRLLIEWNATALELPADPAFHRLIERQAAATPEALAVVAGGQQLTYRELDERANRLAHHLQAKGVAPGVLVGICLERTIEMPVALLGVLKAGGGYLPLDPGYPAERIAFILNDANATLLLTQQSLLGRLPKSAAEPLCIDLEREAIDLCQSSTLEVTQQPDDLAYVIYTSGSTGKPKGVMVPHRAVLNFLGAMTKRPGLGADDVLLAVTTLAFDIAVLELYLPLLVGGRVVIADREEAQDGRDLLALMREHGVTIMQATPATWRLLVESGWQGEPRLKVLCGGEALPKDLAADLIERVGGVWNMYGPTETTVWSTCAEITDAKQPIHVGKPIANTRLYVLDPQQQPVPVGAHGELYIGGTGVTLGYLGREKLTAERFVADPFTGAAEGLYRTGDLVRYNRAGELIYLNRLDNQVKVRGYRIELGEIETVLAACAGIARGVVVVREDRPGDRRLAAYYVLNDGAHTTPTELRKQLRIDLPDYMIPQHFVELDMLPLTPNGKVDRKALPSPFAGGAAEETLIEPETPAEQALAAIWQELLGDARIERHDNFFDVGGHSLLAVQVVVRAEKELGVELSLRSLVSDSLAQIAAGLKLSEALATSGETLPEMEMVAADPGDEPRARKGLFDRLKSKISGKEKG